MRLQAFGGEPDAIAGVWQMAAGRVFIERFIDERHFGDGAGFDSSGGRIESLAGRNEKIKGDYRRADVRLFVDL